MYKNFIFDLYGTLIDVKTDETSKNFYKKYTKWLRKKGYFFTWREFMIPFLRIEQAYRLRPSRYKNPEIAIEPVFREVFATKGYVMDDEKLREMAEGFRRLSTEHMYLYPDSLSCLQALKKAGKRIFLLSNAQRSFTWPELEKTGILPYFDGVLISSDEGCMKPDVAFFDILCNRYSLEKKESIMIGNELQSDVAGAVSAGIDSLYINRCPVFHQEENPTYTYVSPTGSFDVIQELL